MSERKDFLDRLEIIHKDGVKLLIHSGEFDKVRHNADEIIESGWRGFNEMTDRELIYLLDEHEELYEALEKGWVDLPKESS
jgi:hypothetical protein